jgi:hypothetical protein
LIQTLLTIPGAVVDEGEVGLGTEEEERSLQEAFVEATEAVEVHHFQEVGGHTILIIAPRRSV